MTAALVNLAELLPGFLSKADVAEAGRRILRLLKWLLLPRWKGLLIFLGAAAHYYAAGAGVERFVGARRAETAKLSRPGRKMLEAERPRREVAFQHSCGILGECHPLTVSRSTEDGEG